MAVLDLLIGSIIGVYAQALIENVDVDLAGLHLLLEHQGVDGLGCC